MFVHRFYGMERRFPLEKLFLFGNTNAKTIEQITNRLHIRLCIVDPTDYPKTLGQIAGFQNTQSLTDQPKAETLPNSGILVMWNLKNSHMDQLLSALRKYGQEDLYKAVLTPTNANWTIWQLSYALQQERAAME